MFDSRVALGLLVGYRPAGKARPLPLHCAELIAEAYERKEERLRDRWKTAFDFVLWLHFRYKHSLQHFDQRFDLRRVHAWSKARRMFVPAKELLIEDVEPYGSHKAFSATEQWEMEPRAWSEFVTKKHVPYTENFILKRLEWCSAPGVPRIVHTRPVYWTEQTLMYIDLVLTKVGTALRDVPVEEYRHRREQFITEMTSTIGMLIWSTGRTHDDIEHGADRNITFDRERQVFFLIDFGKTRVVTDCVSICECNDYAVKQAELAWSHVERKHFPPSKRTRTTTKRTRVNNGIDEGKRACCAGRA